MENCFSRCKFDVLFVELKITKCDQSEKHFSAEKSLNGKILLIYSSLRSSSKIQKWASRIGQEHLFIYVHE